MKLTERYRAIADDVLRVEEEEAQRSRDEVDSKPRAPAPPEAIALAEKARAVTFPESYRAFLSMFDGWDHFAWGTSLFGTNELSGTAYADAVEVFTYGDDPLPEELAKALVIGASENGAHRLLLLESGEVVDWLYQEENRYADLATYLASRKTTLLRVRARAVGKIREAEREWDPRARAKENRELEAELRKAWKAAGARARSRKPRLPVRRAKAVKPTELVVVTEKKVAAEVGLGLILYLGSTPTKDEVVLTYRAFRRHFPVKGKLEWCPASTMSFFTTTIDDPDGASFIETLDRELRVDDQGYFGLRATLEPTVPARGTYLLNVRGIPPTNAQDDEAKKGDEGESPKVPSASFVEVFVPAREDPRAIEALCQELVDIVHVRSGHGGWFAAVRKSDAKPDPYDTVFGWCRRFLGVEVADVDLWIAGARRRLRGASWLTVLGAPFARVLDEAGALALPAAVARHDGKHGAVVLRAGKEPLLGDVWRGEFPASVASVARTIEPLMIARRGRPGTFSAGGVFFGTFTSELRGAFADHHATGAHLHRFIHPEGLLGQTPREEAEALLEAVCKKTKHDAYEGWLKAKKTGNDGFRELLRLLFAASYAAKTPLETHALEVAARYPDWAPKEVYNNLLIAYFMAGRIEEGMALVPEALRRAKKNPHVYHPAAAILVRAGKLKEALACVKLAKEHGYEHLNRMKTDENLAPLAKRKAFREVFEKPIGTCP